MSQCTRWTWSSGFALPPAAGDPRHRQCGAERDAAGAAAACAAAAGCLLDLVRAATGRAALIQPAVSLVRRPRCGRPGVGCHQLQRPVSRNAPRDCPCPLCGTCGPPSFPSIMPDTIQPLSFRSHRLARALNRLPCPQSISASPCPTHKVAEIHDTAVRFICVAERFLLPSDWPRGHHHPPSNCAPARWDHGDPATPRHGCLCSDDQG